MATAEEGRLNIRQPQHIVPLRQPAIAEQSRFMSTRPSLDGLDQGEFTEGHELDGKTEKQVPKAMIGKRLTQEEAKRLLAKFGLKGVHSNPYCQFHCHGDGNDTVRE